MIDKYNVSEVRRRIEIPLADARGSDRSRDREGAESLEYATVFVKTMYYTSVEHLPGKPLVACLALAVPR